MFTRIGWAASCSHDRDLCPFFLQSKVRNPEFQIFIVILSKKDHFFPFELHTLPLLSSTYNLIIAPRSVQIPSIIYRLFLLSHQSWIDVSLSSAIRNIAADIAEGADLLAGRTPIRDGIGPKGETAIRTFPLYHPSHLLFRIRSWDWGMGS
jgi:hypothetical protein